MEEDNKRRLSRWSLKRIKSGGRRLVTGPCGNRMTRGNSQGSGQ